MSEEYIIENAAPTLAGMKTGSLFTCPCPSAKELIIDIKRINNKLSSKGIKLVVLRIFRGRALIYLYRPNKLAADLSAPEAEEILRLSGYSVISERGCLSHLIGRLKNTDIFPHEIGLFLGYPPDDVKGFIEHGGKGEKARGFWKVYGDVNSAEAAFRKYRKCTAVYREAWRRGQPFERLAVACK